MSDKVPGPSLSSHREEKTSEQGQCEAMEKEQLPGKWAEEDVLCKTADPGAGGQRLLAGNVAH